MQKRFTIIQGGLSLTAAERPQPIAADGTPRVCGWRIVLRRLTAIGEAEVAAWRALADRQPDPDPFADPDYLLTAARHAGRGADIAFAFAYAETAEDGAALGAVLPFVLPHPVWGGSSLRLWHPPLAFRAARPLVGAGSAPAVLEAILQHLCAERPRTALRLGRIDADGDLLRAVTSSTRLRIELHPKAAVPATRFVALAAKGPEPAIERVTAPGEIRDAVERFLALDAEHARRPLIGDPAESAIVRVVARLFAQRGAASVELGRHDGRLVSGALRLGRPGAQVLWRAVNVDEAVPAGPHGADVDIRLAQQARDDAPVDRLRLVTI